MNLPFYKWFPGDWSKNPSIKQLSFEERGFLREMIDYMHGCEYPGKLAISNVPISDIDLSKMMGVSPNFLKKKLIKFLDKKILFRDENGSLFWPDMVKQEQERLIYATNGKRGGRPRLGNQMDKSVIKTTQLSNQEVNLFPEHEIENDNENFRKGVSARLHSPYQNNPPSLETIQEYFQNNSLNKHDHKAIKAESSKFLKYNNSRNWMSGNTPIANWTESADYWIIGIKSPKGDSCDQTAEPVRKNFSKKL